MNLIDDDRPIFSTKFKTKSIQYPFLVRSIPIINLVQKPKKLNARNKYKIHCNQIKLPSSNIYEIIK